MKYTDSHRLLNVCGFEEGDRMRGNRRASHSDFGRRKRPSVSPQSMHSAETAAKVDELIDNKRSPDDNDHTFGSCPELGRIVRFGTPLPYPEVMIRRSCPVYRVLRRFLCDHRSMRGPESIDHWYSQTQDQHAKIERMLILCFGFRNE